MERKKLSEILGTANKTIEDAWNTTQAAADFAPLPPGEYIARIVHGELSESRRGTPGYKLTFEVLEGEHLGRRFWHDLWLTAAALSMSKRDLAKIGVSR